jgi:hypothetical protein
MSDNRVRIWFSLFVLAVFCVGLAGGILLGRSTTRRTYLERPSERGGVRGPVDFGGSGPGPGGGSRRGGGPPPRVLVERLTTELELTPDQKVRIEEVLTTRRARVETLQREVRGRFEEEQRALRDDIRKVLTPAQQETFDRNEKDRSRFGRRGSPR